MAIWPAGRLGGAAFGFSAQSSYPPVPLAVKYSVPFELARLRGVEPPDPGVISRTRTVPAVVPSLFQSSTPFTPSFAAKYNIPFTAVSPCGVEKTPKGLMSLTSTVPAVVPLLFQSSAP